ncbi:hypothetical protein WMY93_015044 [Mugilogobius chulae]|uniref:Uncharacterized protein n=1 Tax=Mugilogobius chulae TaxID=88201 RepID=A0AAW0P2Y3_9GOBI
MASSPAFPANLMEEHLSCSICRNLFTDPVTTGCGHSFCKACLSMSLEHSNDLCPLCKTYLNRTPEVNIVLRNVVEQMKNDREEEQRRERREREEEECDPRRFRGRPGQVQCDICTKMAATKSCLICLASYCDDHLQIHSANQRLKGHKLVAPVENLDQRACLTHGRPLELYSRRQGKCICVLCMEEGEEGVVSTEEEWNRKKVLKHYSSKRFEIQHDVFVQQRQLQKTVDELTENIKDRKTKMDEINDSWKKCKEHLDEEWGEINKVFSEAMAKLVAAKNQLLEPVAARRLQLKNEATDLRKDLQSEVDTLEKTIKELKEISAFEDHIFFLQKYPLSRELLVKDWSAIELDTSVSFGSMRNVITNLMVEIREQLDKLTALELRRLSKFAEDVTLDPTTSHKRLVVSENQKEVIDGETDQETIDHLERFDIFGSILGCRGLDSGAKAYWEVQVGNKSGWDLGVALTKAKRKGMLTLSPENGYWAIVHYEGDKYAALTAPPVCVELQHKPQKVGVFLDYDEGLVSFYNVTNGTHIYSFSKADFTGKILPYFSPHMKNENNTEALIISDVDMN